MDLIEGEEIEEIEKLDEGWWSGVGANGGKRGLFPGQSEGEVLDDLLTFSPPANYVEERTQADDQGPEYEPEPEPEPEAVPPPPPPPPPPRY